MMTEEKEDPVQQQKLEALGHMAGGIAHDFNNILSIIEGQAQIALRQLQQGQLEAGQLEKILQATRRGSGITRQLLAFSRQKVDIDDVTDISAALSGLQILLRPMLGDSISLDLRCAPGTFFVCASEDQITQIFLNLAANAHDAMPRGGKVQVICRAAERHDIPLRLLQNMPEAGYVQASFIDEGVGISEDVMPRIFDPFFTTKHRGRGTGLGLSVVHGLTEQLKGGVEVHPSQGQGTVFEVFLPRVQAEASLIDLPVLAPNNALAGKTVLVTEDEPELLDVLAVMLSDLKMKVLTASNGNHAVEVQRQHGAPIDFLLTDIVMPEMDGITLGGIFSSLRPESNVVYMSGYPAIGKPGEKLPPGALFIQKPLQEEKISQILVRALELREQRLRDEQE